VMDLRVRVERDVPIYGHVCQDLALRCISGRVDAAQVRRFAGIVKEQGAQKGQVISDLEVTPEARRVAETTTYMSALTLDELLDQQVRFDNYLDWLETEIKGQGVDCDYVPLGCTWQEEGTLGEGTCPSRYGPEENGIDKYIQLWLLDARKEHLSILGEFGTGKTWCILHTAWTALQDYRQKKQIGLPRPRLPLVIPLRQFARAINIESLLSEFFFRQHEIGVPSYAAFQQLNRMGRLLLLFDGFDEMAVRVDRQKMIDNFWEFARVLVPGSKAILTCRTEHFPEAKEGKALLNAELKASTARLTGERPQFEVVELDKFTEAQIRQVLSRKSSPPTVERIMQNADLRDLARRPLLVGLVREALPDLEQQATVDLSRVYLYAVRRTMERDIESGRTFTSLADKLYFLCELSWEMLSTDRMSLNYRLFPDRIRRLFGPAVREEKELDHWQHALRQNAMLVRNEEGDYFPAHRSFLEFFAAYKFVAELGVLAPEFTELARDRKDVDRSLPPRDYTWSDYFCRELTPSGQIQLVAPLQSFITEDFETARPGKDLTQVDMLPRNAMAMAAAMVTNDPACLDKLCDMAKEGSGQLAWNTLSLLPLLKYVAPKALAQGLVGRAAGHRLKRGVAWALGEIGVASPAVLEQLERTVLDLPAGGPTSPAAWWESAFALEKLGRFGQRKGRQGDEAVRFLIENLPPDCSLDSARAGLLRCLEATDPHQGIINQCDIVTVVRHEAEIDSAALYRDVLSTIDFSSDRLQRRCYFVVWLCGHLRISESLTDVLRACRHPFGSVRNVAVEALGKMGFCTPEVFDALASALDDSYYRTRFHAAWSLAELRPDMSPDQAGFVATRLTAAIGVEEVQDVCKEMVRTRDILIGTLEPSR